MKCGECKHAVSADISDRVECHRYPPTGGLNAWPKVSITSWCAEFARIEPAETPAPVPAAPVRRIQPVKRLTGKPVQ